MKLGVSGDFHRAQFAKKVGFDFMEENLYRMAALDDAAFSEFVRGYEHLDLPILSFNGYFSPDFALYAPDALAEVKAYSEKALSRAEYVGATLCVLGSGKARSIPEGADAAWCVQRFTDILSICGECADRHGMLLVVEPLRQKETNFLHTVADASTLARRCGAKNVGALVDFFHFSMNGELDSGLFCSEDLLYHAHLARGYEDRGVPREEDIPTLLHWAQMLKAVHYDGDLVLEPRFENKLEPEAELACALPLMRLMKAELEK